MNFSRVRSICSSCFASLSLLLLPGVSQRQEGAVALEIIGSPWFGHQILYPLHFPICLRHGLSSIWTKEEQNRRITSVNRAEVLYSFPVPVNKYPAEANTER